ncbi:MAG: STAS domain-containing protein [Burkholderiales bacterium]|nr:STAS domain-containing protein [Burkholderiales bacterium]
MQAQVQQQNGKSVIRLEGRFDFNAHRTFREAYEPALGLPDISEFEIDFGKVEYLDSSALGMLLMLKEKAQVSGKTVALVNCRGTAKQVLEIANFGKLFVMR